MDLQNSSQGNIPPAPSENRSKGPSVAFGIFIGIVQLIVMFLIVSTLLNWFILSFLFVFLPLVLEVIFWGKKYPHFVKGTVIGTILIPLIGLGLCFALLSQM